ncbi:GNAT family N-acetyltransferase [Microbacterium sp. STN6]|uniref:GNAT family N-acetyltransferase n=1 Tax=Microbacterium sp. STN6 TaxID=2995588 RepID=UPI0022608691|nr:GNAT family N-acetyltransferase [Microbacterium sp. STN6]MCX7522222.1 GNAT family N-acetyltransferase [Microbacterium sp. STN6]
MSITIRPLAEGDFFAWLSLYEGYAETFDTPLDDTRALRVWTWLSDASHEEQAIVAAADDGRLVGLAHFREFARPLANDHGMFIDELYVAPDSREQGAGTALIQAVRGLAAEKGFGVVQWASSGENDPAASLYETLGTRSPAVTYEIRL